MATIAAVTILAVPAAAQDHHQHMPGMTMPAPPAPATVPAEPSGTNLPAGNAAPPPAPNADYADRIWTGAAMPRSRAAMRQEHGGMRFAKVMLDLAELRLRDGGDGAAWDGEGWFGGDRDRLVVRSEGDAVFGRGMERGDVQALYSRAIGPYFDLQAGVRQDLGSRASASHLAIGVEGLAPYWFDVEATAFVSHRGDVTGRIEAYYDQRITQRLILQPRAELELSAQDVTEDAIGAGLSGVEVGVRLRYEIVPEFAPYIGVAWEDAKRERPATNLLIGARFWF